MEEFIGIIKLFAGERAPQGWAFCHGQILSTSAYAPLYSIIGKKYGGDGNKTFALPDLRGRVPVGAGEGPGLANVLWGEPSGSESVMLKTANLPSHKHEISITGSSAAPFVEIPVNTTAGSADVDNPKDGVLGNSGGFNYSSEPPNAIYSGNPIPVKGLNLDQASCQPVGNNVPISIIPPRLGIHFIICTEGIYPG